MHAHATSYDSRSHLTKLLVPGCPCPPSASPCCCAASRPPRPRRCRRACCTDTAASHVARACSASGATWRLASRTMSVHELLPALPASPPAPAHAACSPSSLRHAWADRSATSATRAQMSNTADGPTACHERTGTPAPGPRPLSCFLSWHRWCPRPGFWTCPRSTEVWRNPRHRLPVRLSCGRSLLLPRDPALLPLQPQLHVVVQQAHQVDQHLGQQHTAAARAAVAGSSCTSISSSSRRSRSRAPLPAPPDLFLAHHSWHSANATAALSAAALVGHAVQFPPSKPHRVVSPRARTRCCTWLPCRSDRQARGPHRGSTVPGARHARRLDAVCRSTCSFSVSWTSRPSNAAAAAGDRLPVVSMAERLARCVRARWSHTWLSATAASISRESCTTASATTWSWAPGPCAALASYEQSRGPSACTSVC